MKKLLLTLGIILIGLCSYSQIGVATGVGVGKPTASGYYGAQLDSLTTLTVQPHDLDTAIVTAIGFDPRATNYQLRYIEGLTYPTISTGSLALSSTDSTAFQNLKVKIDVPSENTNYAFVLIQTGVDTVYNSDTTQLDALGVAPDYFSEGLIFIAETDTTQADSIYTDVDSSNLLIEMDGLLFTIEEGDGLGPEMITAGDMSDAGKWIKQSEWTVAGDTAAYDDTDNGNITQPESAMISAIAINTTYQLEFDISISSGNAYFGVLNQALDVTYINYTTYADGHHVLEFTTPADVSGGGICFRAWSGSTDNPFGLDNVSLKTK